MIITLDPDPPPKKWGTTHEKILWFRISLKHLGAKKKNNRKSDNLLEFRRIFLFLNYKFQLLCLQIMKSCLSKCCFPPAYELPKSLLISCPRSKKMQRGIALCSFIGKCTNLEPSRAAASARFSSVYLAILLNKNTECWPMELFLFNKVSSVWYENDPCFKIRASRI